MTLTLSWALVQLTRADPAAVSAALDRAAELGPYFQVSTGTGVELGTVLGTLVDSHAGLLGIAERRVAASILYQGVAARLWSPVLACALDGVLLDVEGLGWGVDPIRLHVPSPRGWVFPPDGAELVADAVLTRHLLPLAAALRAVVRVPQRLLLGNAASALAGTVTVAELGGRGGARSLGEALLRLPALAGTGTWHPGGFRRTSCCLYYRVPGGGLCGDCPLHR